MTLDELENVWEKQAVSGRPPTATALLELQQEVAAARRRFQGMIVLAIGLFVLGWTVALVAHGLGIKRLTPIGLVAQIIASGFYLLWCGLAVQSKRATQHELDAMGQSTVESLKASLRTIDLQIRNYRIAMWALPGALVATTIISWAKYVSGDLPLLGVYANIIFVTVFAGIVGLAMIRRYRQELLRRKRQIEETLRTGE
jgi:threonine/homoserine/homoserine lactone efflux protein